MALDPTRFTLIVATGNLHKLRELRELLVHLPIDVVPYKDVLRGPLSIVEDGDTFEANAIKKARAVAIATLSLTLADDSGLEVDALAGRPGVRSARFAHEHATDAENNAALMTAMAEVEDSARAARFRCVLALIDPFEGLQSAPFLAEGVCEGSIARAVIGSEGFGYDPLFLVREYPDKTMAQLNSEEKNRISHRSRALSKLLPHLEAIVRKRLDDVERISARRPSIIEELDARRLEKAAHKKS